MLGTVFGLLGVVLGGDVGTGVVDGVGVVVTAGGSGGSGGGVVGTAGVLPCVVLAGAGAGAGAGPGGAGGSGGRGTNGMVALGTAGFVVGAPVGTGGSGCGGEGGASWAVNEEYRAVNSARRASSRTDSSASLTRFRAVLAASGEPAASARSASWSSAWAW